MPKTLVEQVESFFYEDPKFQNSMESFARKHCDIIDLSTEENKLEYVRRVSRFDSFAFDCICLIENVEKVQSGTLFETIDAHHN